MQSALHAATPPPPPTATNNKPNRCAGQSKPAVGDDFPENESSVTAEARNAMKSGGNRIVTMPRTTTEEELMLSDDTYSAEPSHLNELMKKVRIVF